jgi:hypothetical protein
MLSIKYKELGAKLDDLKKEMVGKVIDADTQLQEEIRLKMIQPKNILGRVKCGPAPRGMRERECVLRRKGKWLLI